MAGRACDFASGSQGAMDGSGAGNSSSQEGFHGAEAAHLRQEGETPAHPFIQQVSAGRRTLLVHRSPLHGRAHAQRL